MVAFFKQSDVVTIFRGGESGYAAGRAGSDYYDVLLLATALYMPDVKLSMAGRVYLATDLNMLIIVVHALAAM